MALHPAAAFDEFKSKIVLRPLQQAEVQARKGLIDKYLSGPFNNASNMRLLGTKVIGSGGRGTMIRPPDDVDVLAIFDPSQVWQTYQLHSGTFITRVRSALSVHTRVEQVGTRGQAVRLFYSSGAAVDVAPVFPRQGGGFLLPDGVGGWLATNPLMHEKWSAQRNKELSHQMKPLVRMLKAWNRAHSNRLKGFHLEVMVGSVFSSLGNNSRENTQVFFEHAGTQLRIIDPAGLGGDLASYMTANQESAARQSFLTAAKRAASARLAAKRGNHREAIRLWRIIYGGEFPAYG
jgi:Second Messenger Oligonucleotide or Dinucleotide Synthetase domain